MDSSYLFEIAEIKNKKDRFLQIMSDFIDLIYDPVIEKFKDDDSTKL